MHYRFATECHASLSLTHYAAICQKLVEATIQYNIQQCQYRRSTTDPIFLNTCFWSSFIEPSQDIRLSLESCFHIWVKASTTEIFSNLLRGQDSDKIASLILPLTAPVVQTWRSNNSHLFSESTQKPMTTHFVRSYPEQLTLKFVGCKCFSFHT